MAPKKKASRQKKPAADTIAQVMETTQIPLKVESRGDGVVVVESGVKKIRADGSAGHRSAEQPQPAAASAGHQAWRERPRPGQRADTTPSRKRLAGGAQQDAAGEVSSDTYPQKRILINALTKAFDVHKLVISSVSQYFREILAKDPSMKRLELPSLSPLGLANVITFAYLGRVHMSLYTIGCTASAAATLQIPQLLKMCMDFLLAELNVQTCVYIWNIAAAYGLLPVCEAARRFVLENFVQFADTPLFTQLTLEQMSAFLQDDSLLLPSEVTAFQLAMKWLDFDSTRQTHAAELLSHIRFETIPASELVSQIQPVPRMMMDPQCHRLLVDAMNYHLLPYQQNTLQSRRTQIRASQQTLITIGGRPSLTERALSREVLWRDPREGGASWRHLTQLPAKSFNQCVAVMDGFLYVAGGEDQNDARNQAKHAVSTLSRYDPRFNTWLHLASMRQRRTHFSLAASGGRLFAIGGRNVEGATLPSGDILVTGGYINCAYSRSVACYKVDTDTWIEKASMETPRGWHCSATLGGKVYVVGGSQLGPGGERVDVLSVEVFSPESSTWSRAAPLPLGVSTAGLSPLAEKLYLLGGWNEAEKRYKAAVQKYDPATDSWSMAEDLPEPTVGVSCCTLTLPPRHAPRRQQHRNTPAHEEQQQKNRSRESSVAPSQTITA
ncbi:BTB and kelch domain-containing protein 6 Kelch repeat and [Collichthys lucidus]|uniref:BTB and kelch domain-containing protein 6 Kelch repeat and n=1 Tax=Collichthys lucidus TaxID=240159 RepID=A0A4U5VNY3_COLLU|nr:BTB and kelch domain-containing protein 6 Kelch repeat and [Collichthys lucidus]